MLALRAWPVTQHAARPCSALGSAVGLTRQAGELVAIAHATPKTGYKNPHAYGARTVFTSDVCVLCAEERQEGHGHD